MPPIARKLIGSWLLAGCCLVFLQVILGGITRLTESGLSITQWKPINGIIPPLNEQDWKAEFELYKQKAQYQTINEGMTLGEFKWIYFWEYSHRLSARFMGFVFAIGFVYFLFRGWLNKELLYKIAPLFVWGAVEAVYGWLMVSKGLQGIFVPPIHLAIHLLLALSLFAYLVWLILYVFRPERNFGSASKSLRTLSWLILTLLLLQLFFGGLTSGMKAGLAYPTWPDMHGQFIPSAIFTERASVIGFITYNAQDLWGRALIQLVHRLTAYTLVVLIIIFFFKSRNITRDRIFKASLNLFPVFVLLQASIGIITVLNCGGKVPVAWGVLHQAGAMLLVAETVFIIFHLNYTVHEQ